MKAEATGTCLMVRDAPTIKIDRSFVQGIARNERSRRLLHGVSRLSAELGLTVVVEGVETDEQLTLIRNDTHIDEAQGFLLCRPMPARQTRDLLNAGATR